LAHKGFDFAAVRLCGSRQKPQPVKALAGRIQAISEGDGTTGAGDNGAQGKPGCASEVGRV
jgi:hypothetical protein